MIQQDEHAPWNYAELELLEEKRQEELDSLMSSNPAAQMAWQILNGPPPNPDLSRDWIASFARAPEQDFAIDFNGISIVSVIDAILCSPDGEGWTRALAAEILECLRAQAQDHFLGAIERLPKSGIEPESVAQILELFPALHCKHTGDNFGHRLFGAWDLEMPPPGFLMPMLKIWSPSQTELMHRNFRGESIPSRINQRLNDLALGMSDEALRGEILQCAQWVLGHSREPEKLIREFPPLSTIVQDPELLGLIQAREEQVSLEDALNSTPPATEKEDAWLDGMGATQEEPLIPSNRSSGRGKSRL